jgi:DNA-binding XRE family transcriptional regulator
MWFNQNKFQGFKMNYSGYTERALSEIIDIYKQTIGELRKRVGYETTAIADYEKLLVFLRSKQPIKNLSYGGSQASVTSTVEHVLSEEREHKAELEQQIRLLEQEIRQAEKEKSSR